MVDNGGIWDEQSFRDFEINRDKDTIKQLEAELTEAKAEIEQLALEIENKQYTITCESEENQQLKESLAEARAEIENLKWHVSNEKAKAEAALALNDKTLGLVNEARAEIEQLKEGRDFWRNKCEREESEAGKAMIDYVCKEQEFERQLADARADADHWKSECNALQRMVHEARAEIEMLKHQLEDESMRADGMTTAHAEAGAKNYRQQELIEQMREALEKCRDTFASYVLDHSGKLHITPTAPIDLCAPIREKIAKNQRMVDLCDAALAAERRKLW